MCVCLSVQTISAIALKRDTIRISALWERFHFVFKCVVLKFRLFPIYTVPKCGHFLTSVSMRKGYVHLAIGVIVCV